MTPQEKAKELFDKFLTELAPFKLDAKQCALIAVDFALTGLIQTLDDELINYYRQVKEAIKKL